MTIKVLHIEADAADAQQVATMLASCEATTRHADFQLTHVECFRDGLLQLAKQDFHVVLLAMCLPDSAGIRNVQRLLDQNPETAVVVLTAQSDEASVIEAVRSGAQDYVHKDGLSASQLVRSLLYSIERHDRLVAQQKLSEAEREFEAAGAVQTLLLPKEAPQFPGLDISGGCWPYEKAGGDYFDYFSMDGHLGLAIADVSGHGLSAALIMAGLRRLLRSWVGISTDVGEIMSIANRAVWEDTNQEQFVTAFFGHLNVQTRVLTYVAAGHISFLLRASGHVLRLVGESPPLGVFAESEILCSPPVALQPGDILLLLTDGIYEARNPAGEIWGIDAVLATVARHRHRTADEIIGSICEAVYAYCEPDTVADDMALIIVKVLA